MSESKLKYIFPFCFGIFLSISSVNLAFASPEDIIFPPCGPHDFNVMIYATGFLPSSNVAWKLVDHHRTVSLNWILSE